MKKILYKQNRRARLLSIAAIKTAMESKKIYVSDIASVTIMFVAMAYIGGHLVLYFAR